MAPLVGTSQVLSAIIIVHIPSAVNPAGFTKRGHHQLWALISRSHLTATATFDFPHLHDFFFSRIYSTVFATSFIATRRSGL